MLERSVTLDVEAATKLLCRRREFPPESDGGVIGMFKWSSVHSGANKNVI